MSDSKNVLPECMAPDGAEPCKGYRQAFNVIQDLRVENEELKSDLANYIKIASELGEELTRER